MITTSATGDSIAVSGFIVAAVMVNSIAFAIVNVSAAFGVIFPAGISRCAVRGFFASISLSAQRLNPIAVLRANIIHSTT